jgi:hypothetical protein
LWSLVVVLGVLSSAPVAASVAILPADAPGLLPGAKEALDAGIRTAVVAAGFDVQPADRTARFIKEAVAAGLDCNLVDDDCALRAGVAADTDGVIAPQIRRVGNRTVVVLRWLALDVQARGAAAVLDDATPANALLALAKRLQDANAAPVTVLPVKLVVEPEEAAIDVDGVPVERLPTGHVWLLPGQHVLRASASGHASRELVLDVPDDRVLDDQRLVLDRGFPVVAGVGFGMLAVGTIVLATGAAGAGIAEGVLAGSLEPDVRTSVTMTGQIMFGIGVAGATVAAIGGVCAVVGLSE